MGNADEPRPPGEKKKYPWRPPPVKGRDILLGTAKGNIKKIQMLKAVCLLAPVQLMIKHTQQTTCSTEYGCLINTTAGVKKEPEILLLAHFFCVFSFAWIAVPLHTAPQRRNMVKITPDWGLCHLPVLFTHSRSLLRKMAAADGRPTGPENSSTRAARSDHGQNRSGSVLH